MTIRVTIDGKCAGYGRSVIRDSRDTNVPRRVTCPVCGKDVAVTTFGFIRSHKP